MNFFSIDLDFPKTETLERVNAKTWILVLVWGLFHACAGGKSSSQSSASGPSAGSSDSLSLLESTDAVALFEWKNSPLKTSFPQTSEEGAILTSGWTDEASIQLYFQSLKTQSGLSLFQRSASSIFSEEEVRDIAKLVNKSKRNIQNGQIVWIISKFDDPLTPGMRILRTNFSIFFRDDHYHIAFGEIRQSVSFLNNYTFSDWIQAPLPQVSPYKNKQVQAPKTESSSFDPKTAPSNPTKSNPSQTISPAKTTEDRLKELKSICEKKLISEDECKTKRSQILEGL